MWKRDRATRIVIRASCTHFTQASAAKMGCEPDPLQITCSRGPRRGFWDVDMRLTGALQTPMWRPQTLQGRFGEGHKPSQIACGSVIGPPESSSELSVHTPRKQVPRKWDVSPIPAWWHRTLSSEEGWRLLVPISESSQQSLEVRESSQLWLLAVRCVCDCVWRISWPHAVA